MKRNFKRLTTMTICAAISVTSVVPAAMAASTGTFDYSNKAVSIFNPIKDNGAAGDHIHGSSIVELPGGELLCVWFQGNGERDATTTRIMGARSADGGQTWKTPFVMTDAQDIADINPVVYVDSGDRLWFFWYPVLAGKWESSQPMYAYAEKGSYEFGNVGNNKPNWTYSENVNIKIGKNIGGVVDPNSPDDHISISYDERAGVLPENRPSWASAPIVARPELAKSFVKTVKAKLDEQKEYLFKPVTDGGAGMSRRVNEASFDGLATQTMQLIGGDPTKYLYAPTVADKIYEARSGYPYARRFGWQTKDKPYEVDLGNGKVRLILPLYSDSVEISIMAFTEYDPAQPLADNSVRWEMSEPIVGVANIQATMAQKADGTLVAYMRDNGPRPYRVVASESKDKGLTWSTVKDVPELQDPGVGHDLLQLKNGNWAFVHVDTESSRNTLAVALSDDEGKTWKYRRHLAMDTRSSMGSYHYPAITQGDNGDILISFSRFYSSLDTDTNNQSLASYKNIAFARITEDWIKQGDATNIIREYESIDREIAVPASITSSSSDAQLKALLPSTVKAYFSYKAGANNATLPSVELPINWDITSIQTNIGTLNTLLDKKIKGSVDVNHLPTGVTAEMLPASDPTFRVFLYNDPAAVAATGVELNKTSLSVTIGQFSTLTATVTPSNASNKTVIWSSSNESVAKVTNGVVTGVSTGEATITATTLDGGFVKTATVTVVASGGGTDNNGNNGNAGNNGNNGNNGNPGNNGNNGQQDPNPGNKPIFADVTNGYSWAQEAINALAEIGIIQGTSENTFSPEKNISRADIMTMVVRALKLEAKVDSNFDDVDQDAYYAQSLGVAKALGIIEGSGDNKFNPTEEISRQDLMVLVYRALKAQGKLPATGTAEDLKKFNDSSNISEYALEGVATLVKAGIIEGSGDELNPNGKATRAEVAIIVHRILNKMK